MRDIDWNSDIKEWEPEQTPHSCDKYWVEKGYPPNRYIKARIDDPDFYEKKHRPTGTYGANR